MKAITRLIAKAETKADTKAKSAAKPPAKPRKLSFKEQRELEARAAGLKAANTWHATRATIPEKGPVPLHMFYLPGNARLYTDAAALSRRRERPALPEPGWLWIAEDDSVDELRPDVVGMVGLTVEEDRVGQVRWFLVAPHARGGLGRSLMTTLLVQARSAGLEHLRLWTVDGLGAAARLYASLGFRRTEEVPGHRFGQDLVEVRYDLEVAAAARLLDGR